jgi:hypothetical protein
LVLAVLHLEVARMEVHQREVAILQRMVVVHHREVEGHQQEAVVHQGDVAVHHVEVVVHQVEAVVQHREVGGHTGVQGSFILGAKEKRRLIIRTTATATKKSLENPQNETNNMEDEVQARRFTTRTTEYREGSPARRLIIIPTSAAEEIVSHKGQKNGQREIIEKTGAGFPAKRLVISSVTTRGKCNTPLLWILIKYPPNTNTSEKIAP